MGRLVVGQGFLGGAERGGPEGSAVVEVGDVDDEVAEAAAVH